MKYKKVVKGSFVDRPNRFIAHVKIDDEIQTVHVKNTGRCRELLLPDAEVYLEVADNPARKTDYDLIAVYKENFGLINIDSQAPNKVAKEWLETQNYDVVKPEYKYGNSRIDFYMKKGQQEYLMEGVTEVRANEETHPEFKETLEEARAAGVKVLFLMCKVEKDSHRVVEQRE